MAENISAVDVLKKHADQAYAKYPDSCSHSVNHVIKQYLPEQAYLQANALLNELACTPRWQSVHVSEVQQLANKGELVVGGLASKNGNGHVIIIYPGQQKMAGGYTATIDGKTQTVRPRGPYPLAMSTSLGSWPGAMSKGDKTVWDPWGTDKAFKEVKFWRLDLSAKDKTSTCKK